MGGPNLCRTQGADCQSKAETSSEDSSPKKKTKQEPLHLPTTNNSSRVVNLPSQRGFSSRMV